MLPELAPNAADVERPNNLFRSYRCAVIAVLVMNCTCVVLLIAGFIAGNVLYANDLPLNVYPDNRETSRRIGYFRVEYCDGVSGTCSTSWRDGAINHRTCNQAAVLQGAGTLQLLALFCFALAAVLALLELRRRRDVLFKNSTPVFTGVAVLLLCVHSPLLKEARSRASDQFCRGAFPVRRYGFGPTWLLAVVSLMLGMIAIIVYLLRRYTTLCECCWSSNQDTDAWVHEQTALHAQPMYAAQPKKGEYGSDTRASDYEYTPQNKEV